MTLKKPSDIFDKKPEDLNIPFVESDNSFRDELSKVENLSDQIIQLQQEISQKVIQSDLEKLVFSHINNIRENFENLQNDFKKTNKNDIAEFKERVSEITEIVGNLVENELPKYRKQVTKSEVRIGDKFDELKEVVEENIVGIRNQIDTKVNDIAEVIDNNLEYFNTQLQETSSEVKKTTDTYNKISNILESKVLKENEKLEEYSKVIQSIHEEFIELEKSFQEETFEYNKIIEDKFESISSNINIRIDSIDENINNKIVIIGEEVDNFKYQVSSEVSNIKTDVVIFEKHNKDTQKTIQEFSEKLYKISEIDNDISNINEDIGKLQNQYGSVSNQSIETKKDLEVVERYIQNHHKELLELKEEVFGEIQQLPLGNLQENLERLENKIDYIKETYSKIEPEVIVKEVIKEGLLNEPPDTKNSDPLTPLDQNFVTLDQLQQHYRLFINRIQQQISTIGGGGETRLKYLDDIVGIATNASAYDGKFLKYNHNIGKFEFVTVSGGGGSQTLNDTLGLGNTSSLGMSVGVVTATSFSGSGTALTGIVTSIIAGTNVTISGSTGQVTINASGGGGSSQWVTTDVGIHTLSNVGIGTTNATSKLTVVGDARITGILTIGTSSLVFDGTDNKIYVGSGVTISATEISIGSNIIGSGGFSGNASSATYATNAGIATYATYATDAGIATYATNAGIATYATNAGIATYATNAGISTTAQGLTGTPNLSVGIITATQFSTGALGTGVNISTDTISGPSLLYIDPAAVGDNTGAVRIKGDLYVDGTQFIVNSTTIELADFNVGIATTVGTNALLDGAGIGIGSTSIRKTLTWSNSSTALKSSEDFDVASGKVYKINGTSVLSNNTLGSNIVTSSLTSVGTLGSLSVGNVDSTGIITATSFSGNSSSATYATNAGIATYATNAGIATYATSSGIATYATSSGIATYATNAGISTYATNAGIATYATNAGIATYATNAGIATYATNAGIATYATNAGIATYATNAGIATYATNAGIATYATYATNAGIATYATNAGIATYATNAGIATYATNAGISTTAQGLTGSPNLSVGVVTATSFTGSGTALTGIVTSIIAGTNVTVSGSTGQVTINSTASGGGSQTLNDTLGLGNTSSLGMSVGVVTATSFSGSGTALTGIVTSIIAGTNITVSGSTGQVTINSTASGGGSSQWVTTDVGIHTLSNVGIGTTNATSKLTVVGDARITGILTIGTSSIVLDGENNKIYVGSGVTISATEISIGSNIIGSGGFSGNASSATFATNAGIATYATSSGIATYATNAGIATFATSSGIATYATNAGIATSVISGIVSVTQLNVSGISTFTSGPVLIGSATSTGTTSQPLQVIGGAYVSGSVGIGTTNPTSALTVVGVVSSTSFSGSGTGLTGIVTSIVAGTNVTISGSTGQVTINSTASGGGSSVALDLLEVMLFA